MPTPALANLFVAARSNYDWPSGIGAAASQTTIINLEASVSGYIAALSAANAHRVVVDASRWAGNNASSHQQIVAASAVQKATMHVAITNLLSSTTACAGIDALCGLPGVSLVIASKIYRFCCPSIGAAVDRHASYFFNSLRIAGGGFATYFARQWSNRRHVGSRLAIYSATGYNHNKVEYFQTYLPRLAGIAHELNSSGNQYRCASTGLLKAWMPADVEMAAYYWWAVNGAR
ncbi:MAG TPA: hypothetical protein VNZ53_03380 [Steroidobacteraceae bacterium]|nr:hypothetical protein [Steroidobacteraceae bacterium]